MPGPQQTFREGSNPTWTAVGRLFGNRSLVRSLLVSIGIGVAAIQIVGGTFAILHEKESIRELSIKRGEAALDMLASVHTQAMINRNQVSDGDPAIATLNGTMEQFSTDSHGVRLWLVMGPKVLDYQTANHQVELEGPQDEVDSRVIASAAPLTTFAGDKLRMSRPVILGVGRAAHDRCSACHTGAMGIVPGEVIGVYSAEMDLTAEMAAWHVQVWRQVLRSLFVMFTTLGLVALLIQLMMVRPLARLTRAANQIGRESGQDLDADSLRQDEVGHLARALIDARRSVGEKAEIQTFLDAVISNLPALITVKDARTGKFILANPATEQAMGRPSSDIVGRLSRDLFSPEDAARIDAEDQRAIASGGLTIEENSPVTSADGTVRFMTTRKVVTSTEEGPRHLIVLSEDVTDRHLAAQSLAAALESAERANRSQSAFLANMSHEIRTPLNGVIAVADLLSRKDISADSQALVKIIQESGETLTELLSDILDIARIESGEVKIETAPFDLGELLRTTSCLFRMKADEKGVAISLEVEPEVDRNYFGDQTRIKQIVTNFLSNAVKFTNAGAIKVGACRSADGKIRISVKDSGIGFAPDFKDRVFERFQQADDTITREYGGTGLGLAISSDLARMMGGTIECESTPGDGSTFWLELDLSLAGEIETISEPSPSQANSETTLRVLVADDHPTNRQIAELMLSGVAEVVSVENGLEAVDLLRTRAFDLVLMDMQMPVMDGLTAVQAIRASSVMNRNLPIVMMTANVLADHVTASLEAGADVHLEKPITAAKLFAAIDEAIRLRAAAEMSPDPESSSADNGVLLGT